MGTDDYDTRIGLPASHFDLDVSHRFTVNLKYLGPWIVTG